LIDGALLLDKPLGLSSNAALQKAKQLFGAAKAGHAGTLDPLASGLLLVLFGEATKFAGPLLDADKEYLATLKLGERTATGDAEGEVLDTRPVHATPEGLAAVLERFRGEIEQVPPMHSALKHKGTPLYRLARQGQEVERAPRRVRIERLECLGAGGHWLDFEVTCSKGTYVRSLAEDLARALGTVGHVASLRRTGLGPFTGQRMHTLEAIEQAGGEAGLAGLLLAVDSALPELPAIQLEGGAEASILQGRTVALAGPGSARVRMYGPGGRFLGIGRISAEGGHLAPERIMVALPSSADLRA
jgi:tRNA pseudouridine55 synthase